MLDTYYRQQFNYNNFISLNSATLCMTLQQDFLFFDYVFCLILCKASTSKNPKRTPMKLSILYLKINKCRKIAHIFKYHAKINTRVTLGIMLLMTISLPYVTHMRMMRGI